MKRRVKIVYVYRILDRLNAAGSLFPVPDFSSPGLDGDHGLERKR
jgi:hypothetical protein